MFEKLTLAIIAALLLVHLIYIRRIWVKVTTALDNLNFHAEGAATQRAAALETLARIAAERQTMPQPPAPAPTPNVTTQLAAQRRSAEAQRKIWRMVRLTDGGWSHIEWVMEGSQQWCTARDTPGLALIDSEQRMEMGVQ